MHAFENGKDNGYWGKDPLASDTPEEIELAFQLQSSKSDDPIILSQLVEQYASELSLWIRISLFYQDNAYPASEHYLSLLENTFQYALAHTDEFHGRASVRDWLFSISYQMIRSRSLAAKFNKLIANVVTNTKISPVKKEEEKLTRINQLPERIRSAIILRYLFKLEVHDIAAILNLSSQEVQRRLILGRRKMFGIQNPAHFQDEILENIDGLLNDVPDKQITVLQHIESCGACKKYTVEIDERENWLSKNLQKQWVETLLNKEELEIIINSLKKKREKDRVHWHLQIPYKQAAWIMGLSVMFISLAVIFIRMTPVEKEFPTAQLTSTPVLPPIVDLPQRSQSIQNQVFTNKAPQYIDPAFTNDGEWAVFASIRTDPDTQALLLPSIELYSRSANSLQVISEGEGTIRLPWTWWNLSPSISGDGQWIAYVSSSDAADITGDPCKTPDQQSCLDIFLYNRRSGVTTRVTQGNLGGAADGDSLAPTISEDGQWIAFWSAANNLTEEGEDNCQTGERKITCLYIYLYNIQNGDMQRIPARNIPGDVVFGVDRISLSANGRYVGFTATPSSSEEILSGTASQYSSPILFTGRQGSLLTMIPTLLHPTEAVVYDREKGLFEFENQAQDGSFGYGASSSPVLSADGRYVAFLSDSDNLVENDINNFGDVFLRDRETGRIVLISISSSGTQGNASSGSTFWSRGYYSLNLSSDGRYVVFESSATNLGQNVDTDCNHVFANICNLLYLHDTHTGITQWISALPNQDFSLFPEISADGKYLTFMQSFYNCSSEQFFCSNVMLFDTQRQWMANLTQYDQETQSLPWNYSKSVLLPWGSWESTAMSFSPDGNLIALGGMDSSVRVWEISNIDASLQGNASFKVLRTMQNEYFTSLAFSPDSEWLAAGTASGVVYIWNLSDDCLIYTLKDQFDPIKQILFTKDNSSLYIATMKKVWYWRIGEHELINISAFSFEINTVYALAIDTDGSWLATAKADGTVWIQNLPTGEVITRIKGDNTVANSLSFSKDGSLLGFHSLSGKIFVWQISTSGNAGSSVKFINSFQSDGYISGLQFSRDDRYIASTGKIGEVTLISINDGNIYTLSTSVPSGMVYSIDFSDEGTQMAVAFENYVLIWKIPADYKAYFFNHSASDQYGCAEPLPKATANDLPDVMTLTPIIEAGQMSVDRIANILQFPLIIPAHLPDFITFSEAGISEDGSIWLQYEIKNQYGSNSSLFIFEHIITDPRPPNMTIGANALVTPLTINIDGEDVTAEYVSGDWSVATGFSSQPGSSVNGEMTNIWLWNDHSASKRLRWKQYGILIAMYFRVEKLYTPVLADFDRRNKATSISILLSQADMIQIARGMKWYMEVSNGSLMLSQGQSPEDHQILSYESDWTDTPSAFSQNNITNGALDIE
jgi:WD40 repeat protein/DNA-directed RNA polymerase specialized sigma24 family protein